jgi:hypothetical protein
VDSEGCQVETELLTWAVKAGLVGTLEKASPSAQVDSRRFLDGRGYEVTVEVLDKQRPGGLGNHVVLVNPELHQTIDSVLVHKSQPFEPVNVELIL